MTAGPTMAPLLPGRLRACPNHDPEPQASACANRTVKRTHRQLRLVNEWASAQSDVSRGLKPAAQLFVGERGFSLLELMIAIIILGMGLVMVATMFPVAWGRARDLSEFTSETAITEGAHATVKLLTHVNRGALYVNNSTLKPSITPIYGSFAGDVVFDPNFTNHVPPDPVIIATNDTRVHQLYLENMTVAGESQPRAFMPRRSQPWSDENAPWLQEGLLDLEELVVTYCPSPKKLKFYCDWMFLSPQVRFESRVYPPMDARPYVDAAGVLEDDEPEAQLWDESFDAVRFAWAAFNKLDEPAGGTAPTLAEAEEAVRNSRTFRMYYVSLRRPLPTLRYARQNAQPGNIADPNAREEVFVPVALPPDKDVLLPAPWRVQIRFPETVPPEVNRTGVPTVVEVNTAAAETAGFVVDMFPSGAKFIDEINGQVFTVVKRRLAGNDLDQAYLTLDREVVVEDIDDGTPIPGATHGAKLGVIEPDEQLRAVWVFPPPVDSARGSDDEPVFVGKQPVIGIETKVLKFPPV